MPNVVVQTTVSATMNAAAAAKTDLQRALTHNSRGKSEAVGTTATHGSRGNKTTRPLTMVSITNTAAPSITSLRRGRSRTA